MVSEVRFGFEPDHVQTQLRCIGHTNQVDDEDNQRRLFTSEDMIGGYGGHSLSKPRKNTTNILRQGLFLGLREMINEKYDWAVMVRVARKWTEPVHEANGAHLIVIDESSTRMEVWINYDVVHGMPEKLSVGKNYKIRHLIVQHFMALMSKPVCGMRLLYLLRKCSMKQPSTLLF
ncbi:uncharacterized protein LOC141724298 [Apium graveolens]|uniref:uncharacterized protein LOC141724298 n=1 Tax=Apium graveolens TaxID=4045 RepID=UPI003D7BBCE4